MGSAAPALEPMLIIPEATESDRKSGFDYTANHYLGISGEEFLERLDAHLLDIESVPVKRVLSRLWMVRETARF